MSESKSILNKSSEFVIDFFKKNLPEWAKYHNLQHTVETVNGCVEIGKGSNLSQSELEIVSIAGWFHDTGYVFTVEGHEEISIDILKNFLQSNNYLSDNINTIAECILATKITSTPKNIVEFIIRDSDLISLGQPDYLDKNDLLKLEIELRTGKKISELHWLRRSLKFLSSHKFYTEYSKQNFNEQLKRNLSILKSKIDEFD